MKEDEFTAGVDKEVEKLEETSCQKDIIFNIKCLKIKEGDEVRATFVDQDQEPKEIKAKKKEQLGKK